MAEKFDLNQARYDELASLPEIGEQLARRIVEYREMVWFFSDLSELLTVEGISQDVLALMGDRISITAVSSSQANYRVRNQKLNPDRPLRQRS